MSNNNNKKDTSDEEKKYRESERQKDEDIIQKRINIENEIFSRITKSSKKEYAIFAMIIILVAVVYFSQKELGLSKPSEQAIVNLSNTSLQTQKIAVQALDKVAEVQRTTVPVVNTNVENINKSVESLNKTVGVLINLVNQSINEQLNVNKTK
jgi:hypothetical protein